jgi:hypothetical protein
MQELIEHRPAAPRAHQVHAPVYRYIYICGDVVAERFGAFSVDVFAQNGGGRAFNCHRQACSVINVRVRTDRVRMMIILALNSITILLIRKMPHTHL